MLSLPFCIPVRPGSSFPSPSPHVTSHHTAPRVSRQNHTTSEALPLHCPLPIPSHCTGPSPRPSTPPFPPLCPCAVSRVRGVYPHAPSSLSFSLSQDRSNVKALITSALFQRFQQSKEHSSCKALPPPPHPPHSHAPSPPLPLDSLAASVGWHGLLYHPVMTHCQIFVRPLIIIIKPSREPDFG